MLAHGGGGRSAPLAQTSLHVSPVSLTVQREPQCLQARVSHVMSISHVCYSCLVISCRVMSATCVMSDMSCLSGAVSVMSVCQVMPCLMSRVCVRSVISITSVMSYLSCRLTPAICVTSDMSCLTRAVSVMSACQVMQCLMSHVSCHVCYIYHTCHICLCLWALGHPACVPVDSFLGQFPDCRG